MPEPPAPTIGDRKPCEYSDCPGTMTLEEQRLPPRRGLNPGARAGTSRRVVAWQCDTRQHHRGEERGARAGED